MTKRLFLIAAIALVFVLALGIGGTRTVDAQAGSPWTSAYFNNGFLIGNPVFVTTDSFINFNWGFGSPNPAVPVDNFSARYTTTAFFAAGVYRFSILADDGFTLRVNNTPFLNTFNAPVPGKVFTVDVPIQQGFTTIQVDYLEITGVAFISVNWFVISGGGVVVQPPITVPTAVPPGTLVPSQSSVVTQFGDFTPCIRNGTHQVNCFVSDGAWNSPNRGSIELEPRIQIWRQCTPDSVVTQQVFVGQPPQRTSCSKTGAGFYVIRNS
jgi:hypothetical protein